MDRWRATPIVGAMFEPAFKRTAKPDSYEGA
jgi:hypothetical protein